MCPGLVIYKCLSWRQRHYGDECRRVDYDVFTMTFCYTYRMTSEEVRFRKKKKRTILFGIYRTYKATRSRPVYQRHPTRRCPLVVGRSPVGDVQIPSRVPVTVSDSTIYPDNKTNTVLKIVSAERFAEEPKHAYCDMLVIII